MRNLLVVGLLLFVLGGCSVGPKYKKPEFHPPATFYTQEEASSDSAADLGMVGLVQGSSSAEFNSRVLRE